MAKELGGEAFQKNVLRVNLRIRIWEIWAKPVNPYFVSVAHMAGLTPKINAAQWKRAIDDCLPQPLQEKEDVYLLENSGLYVTDKFVNEYRSKPAEAVHWITMVVLAYLFSATSFKMQSMATLQRSNCEDYMKTIAPFAKQALYAEW